MIYRRGRARLLRPTAIVRMDAMPPELRISYVIQVTDLEALLAHNEAARRRTRSRMRDLPNALVQTALWSLVTYVFGFGSSHAAASVAVGAFVGGLWFMAMPGLVRRVVMQRMRKRLSDPGSRFLLGPRTMEIDTDRFAIIGADSETRINWPALQSVVETPERVFLYVTGFTAHVVPLHAADRAALIAELRRHAPSAFAGSA